MPKEVVRGRTPPYNSFMAQSGSLRPLCLIIGLGFVTAVKWFVLSWLISGLAAVTPVSLSLAFRPFWRVWPIALAASVAISLSAALALSLAKERRKVGFLLLASACIPFVGEFAVFLYAPFLIGRWVTGYNG